MIPACLVLYFFVLAGWAMYKMRAHDLDAHSTAHRRAFNKTVGTMIHIPTVPMDADLDVIIPYGMAQVENTNDIINEVGDDLEIDVESFNEGFLLNQTFDYHKKEFEVTFGPGPALNEEWEDAGTWEIDFSRSAYAIRPTWMWGFSVLGAPTQDPIEWQKVVDWYGDLREPLGDYDDRWLLNGGFHGIDGFTP